MHVSRGSPGITCRKQKKLFADVNRSKFFEIGVSV
jgi:hypothetical protein